MKRENDDIFLDYESELTEPQIIENNFKEKSNILNTYLNFGQKDLFLSEEQILSLLEGKAVAVYDGEYISFISKKQ